MTKPLYQLDNVRVHYHGKQVLHIPNLSIAQGDCIALLGENGAGKSSLISLLAGLKKPDSGHIKIDGKLLKLPLNPQYRQRIGWVSQHPYLLASSVKANLQLALKLQSIPAEQHEPLIAQALQQTNCTHLINQDSHTLSGGELKRVAIARAIVYQADIILLDEPFSHLDTQHSQLLENCINTLSQQNKTIVFATHNKQQGIKLADKTIMLINGDLASSE